MENINKSLNSIIKEEVSGKLDSEIKNRLDNALTDKVFMEFSYLLFRDVYWRFYISIIIQLKKDSFL